MVRQSKAAESPARSFPSVRRWPATGQGGLVESKGSVLLVDDERALLTVLARSVRSHGYVVEEASNGQIAVDRLRGANFDVVVSDINMPGMDGIKLLRAIREYDLDLPVILMTAAPAVETASRAVEYGALRYLTKPVSLDGLANAIQYGVQLCKMALLKREALAVLGKGADVAADRAGLEARYALALKGLSLAFQPLMSVTTKGVYAYEALLRSREPTMSSPLLVLDAAERLGQLPQLGRAIRGLVANVIPQLMNDTIMFVNLHPQDLLDERLFSASEPMSRFADRIVLEITERATLEEIPDFRDRAARLRSMGFRLAVDDLGAGYSGLASVVQLQPEIIKFDVALIRDIDKEPTKQRLVRSMMDLCHEMGILAVAEGIESAAERDTLVSLGCDLLQGFLFSRPVANLVEPRWS
jgi:EAL domain-containing protein (putative c-di-GMP-specific phosphodiesterase class I)/ActR/RegA family two-component response regulator